MERRGEHRFDPGNIKNRVDPTKWKRESEPDIYQINHHGDAVWTNETKALGEANPW